MLLADAFLLDTLSVPVSLTPSSEYCCLPGVSQLRFHSSTCLFPTGRFPVARFASLQAVLLARYDFRQPVPHAPLLASRLIIRVTVIVRSRCGDGLPQRAGQLFSRFALLSGSSPERLSDIPSSHETLAPDATFTITSDSHLRPALRPRSSWFALPWRSNQYCPRALKRRGPQHCDYFGAQSRGSVLAVYASCRLHRRLCKTRLRLVVSLYRPRFREVGSFRTVSVSFTFDPFVLPWASLGAI